MASPAVVEPPPVGFVSVGSGLSSQLTSSSQVSSPVSPDSASGASDLAGSLSKPSEVSTISGPEPSSLVPPLSSPELMSQDLGSLAPDLVYVRDFSGVLCSSQQASPAVALGQAKVPQAWKAGCGSAFPGVSSEAEELGELLRLSLPMMSESRASIYPSESKSLIRYSRKRKDAQLNKFLLAESLAAITTSPSPLGHHHSPHLESVAVREPPVNFYRRGFLLPSNHSSPPHESLRGGVSEEVVGSLGVVFDAELCLQTVGISFERNVKGFLNVMAQVVEGQRLEVSVSTPKVKGNRELHNLEYDIIMMLGVLVLLGAKARESQ
jgi:hypothetical protein